MIEVIPHYIRSAVHVSSVLCAVIAAWLKDSQRSQDGVRVAEDDKFNDL